MKKKKLIIVEITKDNVWELINKGAVKITTRPEQDADFVIMTNPNVPLSVLRNETRNPK